MCFNLASFFLFKLGPLILQGGKATLTSGLLPAAWTDFPVFVNEMSTKRNDSSVVRMSNDVCILIMK